MPVHRRPGSTSTRTYADLLVSDVRRSVTRCRGRGGRPWPSLALARGRGRRRGVARLVRRPVGLRRARRSTPARERRGRPTWRRRGGWRSCPTARRWSPSGTARGSCRCRPAAARPRGDRGREAAPSRRGRPARHRGVADVRDRPLGVRLLHGGARTTGSPGCASATRHAGADLHRHPEGAATTTAAGSRSGRTACCTSAPATPATGRRRRTGPASAGKILRLTPGRAAGAGQPVRRLAGLQLRATATCRAWPGTRGGQLYASEFGQNHVRRAQPDRGRRQLRLAGGRGRLGRRAVRQPDRDLGDGRRVAERHRGRPGRQGVDGLPARAAAVPDRHRRHRRARRCCAASTAGCATSRPRPTARCGC